MELEELARRALPVNVMLVALLAFSAAGIAVTNVEISPATEYIIYFSAGFLTLNFLIIYAVYRYRIQGDRDEPTP
jgi:predicted neutral ceramidase superfamily lipid hydrolase